jgi:hypothetical protein
VFLNIGDYGFNESIFESKLFILTTNMKVGNRNRSKEATEANEVSSRSHAVL